MPLLRPRVRGRARARAARLGRRRRTRWRSGRTCALPWPEAATIEEETLDEQIAALARELPARPLVLGGCCCSHVGAVRELARRHGRLGVVWIDAHGDLNTPESVAVGKRLGDAAADADRRRRRRSRRDVMLLGRGTSIRPRSTFIADAGIRQELGELPERVYVALDCDVIEPRRPGRLHARARRDEARRASRRSSRAAGARAAPGSPASSGSARNEALLRPARPRARPVSGRVTGATAGSKLSHVRGPDRRPGRAQERSTARREASTRTPARSAGRTIATTS